MSRPPVVVVLISIVMAQACREAPLAPSARLRPTDRSITGTTLVVDDDGQGSATDCNASSGAFAGVQAAVNAAVAGDLVLVCPGYYDERVTVSTNDLTIRAAGSRAVIRPTSAPINTTLLSGNPVRAIIVVNGVTGVALEGLTIDGALAETGRSLETCGGGLPFYVGIFYRGGSGRVYASHVTNLQSDDGCSFGVFAQSVLGGSQDLTVTGSVFDGYGSGGVVCTGPETRCTIAGNRVTGLGKVDDQLQTGIAIRFGASAEMYDNEVTDHYFTPKRIEGPAGGISAKSAGIFLFAVDPATNPHLHERNAFARNELDVQRLLTEQVVFK